MKPIVLSIYHRSDIAEFAYAGIESNKWIYAKLISKDFPKWPKYIKVRKKCTYANHKLACEYYDECDKKRHSFVQILSTDNSEDDFPDSNLIVKLETNENIIPKVDEIVSTNFFEDIYFASQSDSGIKFEKFKKVK